MPRIRFSSPLYRCFTTLALAIGLLSVAWAQSTFEVLYNFKGGTDGVGPSDAALTIGSKGEIFGTTVGGGTGKCGGGCGTAYQLTPHDNGKWTKTVLHDFQYSKTDGYFPLGGVILGKAGNLYGTTQLGGTYDDGLVFELTRGVSGWTESILYNFGSHANDPGAPHSGLVRDNAGNFYGTGVYPYELSPGTGGRWHERVLYRFHPVSGKDGTDGDASNVPLILDPIGNLYGTTELGGNYSLCSGSGGCGTVFELTREADGKWKEHVLHRFAQFKNDGQLPMAGLVMDGSGNLYGTTYEGGKYQNGTVFELSRDADGRWKENILYEFPSSGHASNPSTGLLLDKTSNLYGAADGGSGSCDWGVVFRLTRGSGGQWDLRILHEFCGTDGQFPQALNMDEDGDLYGTTLSGGQYLNGVVFKITP